MGGGAIACSKAVALYVAIGLWHHRVLWVVAL